MHIKFVNPGFQYMLDSIMEFQKDDTPSYWNDSLYHFNPTLDKEYAYSLSTKDRREYLKDKLYDIYLENEKLLQEKVGVYEEYWNRYESQISEAFSEQFGINCSAEFSDLVCNISLNPISPRYLIEHSFDVFYLNSERGALGNALHEITHFIWFSVWNQLYNDSYDEYETPSLKWILSEMVVELILSDSRLCSINPYYPRENGGCIYSYFFTLKVEGKNILDIFSEMYQNTNIRDFMKKSYEYCLQNEDVIRLHIRESEH